MGYATGLFVFQELGHCPSHHRWCSLTSQQRITCNKVLSSTVFGYRGKAAENIGIIVINPLVKCERSFLLFSDKTSVCIDLLLLSSSTSVPSTFLLPWSCYPSLLFLWHLWKSSLLTEALLCCSLPIPCQEGLFSSTQFSRAATGAENIDDVEVIWNMASFLRQVMQLHSWALAELSCHEIHWENICFRLF